MKTLYILFIFISFSTFSSTKYFQVNNEHSHIKFSIRYMNVSDVEGRFKNFEIFYEENENRVENIRGRILVGSIDTDDKKRDSHLLTKDFFDEKKYPIIEFKSKQKLAKIKNEQDLNFEITVKNVTKNLSAKVSYLGKRKDPFSNKEGDYFSVKFPINRKEFDIRWNKVLDNGSLLLSDNVNLNISIESYQVGQRPAYSRFFTPRTKNNGLKKTAKKKELTKRIAPIEGSIDSSKRPSFKLKTIIITFISGFTLFLGLIAISYYGQKHISHFLENKGFEDRTVFVITNTIIMILITILAIYTAPFMGFGPNPLESLF